MNQFINSTDDGIDTVFRFSTFDDNGTVYYKVVANGNGVTIYSLPEPKLSNSNNSESYKKDKESFLEKRRSMLQDKNTLGVERKTISRNEQNFDDKVRSLFENKTKPQDSVAGKLMRQTHYNNSNNNKIEFVGNKDTFTTVDSFHDPITNKHYSDATQYALETNGFYSDLDFVAQEDDYGNVKPISNLNPFGPAGLRFNIDVENVTSIPKGKLEESPEKMMRTIAYNSNMEFKQVFDVIDYVDQELDKRSNNVTETHTGLNTDPNKSKRVMSVSYQKTNTGLHFDFGYTDLVLENLYKDDKINNPILGLLHERIHKTILLAVENSKFSENTIEDAKIKLQLISEHHTLIQNFIYGFDKDINSKLKYETATGSQDYNEEFLNKLSTELGISDRETIIKVVESTIKILSEEIKTTEAKINELSDIINSDIDENSKIEKLKTFKYGDAVAQELYTYMTNPYIAKLLSIVEPSTNKYSRKTNEKQTFIDKLVDLLLKVYNSIIKVISSNGKYTEIKDSGYFTQAKDMLTDLYNTFSNEIKPEGSTLIKNNKNDIAEETKPVTTESSEISQEEIDSVALDLLLEIDDDFDLHDVQMLSESNNNSIFVQNSLNVYNQSFVDDNNLSIC